MTDAKDAGEAHSENETAAVRHASLREAVGRSVALLQGDYLGGRGERTQARARGRLAVLRRSAGATPEQHPLTLQEVLDSLVASLEPRLLGQGDAPSSSERAAYQAMTLFALHMQSATTPMHVRGRSFGHAVGLLQIRSSSGSTKPRIDAMLAAREERSRLQHARSLITLLRGERIGLDYGWLAQDLHRLAGQGRSGVLLRWSRDVATAGWSTAPGTDIALSRPVPATP